MTAARARPGRASPGQGRDADLLEEYDIPVVVVLQADEALVGPRPPIRLVPLRLRGNRVAFPVVRHLDAVHRDRRARSVESDLQRVPLAGTSGAGLGLRQ